MTKKEKTKVEDPPAKSDASLSFTVNVAPSAEPVVAPAKKKENKKPAPAPSTPAKVEPTPEVQGEVTEGSGTIKKKKRNRKKKPKTAATGEENAQGSENAGAAPVEGEATKKKRKRNRKKKSTAAAATLEDEFDIPELKEQAPKPEEAVAPKPKKKKNRNKKAKTAAGDAVASDEKKDPEVKPAEVKKEPEIKPKEAPVKVEPKKVEPPKPKEPQPKPTEAPKPDQGKQNQKKKAAPQSPPPMPAPPVDPKLASTKKTPEAPLNKAVVQEKPEVKQNKQEPPKAKPEQPKEAPKPEVSKVEAKPQPSKQEVKPQPQKQEAKPQPPKETPKPEAPKQESPKASEPKPKETPKPEPPKAAEVKPQPPKQEAKPQPPKETPKPEAPKVSEVKPPAPKETPKPEPPKAAEVKPQSPKQETKPQPPKETPKPEPPKVAEVKPQEPKQEAKPQPPKEASKPESPKTEVKSVVPVAPKEIVAAPHKEVVPVPPKEVVPVPPKEVVAVPPKSEEKPKNENNNKQQQKREKKKSESESQKQNKKQEAPKAPEPAKPVEAPKVEPAKPVEAPKVEPAKPVEAPKVEPAKPVEPPKVAAPVKAPESPKVEPAKPVEVPKQQLPTPKTPEKVEAPKAAPVKAPAPAKVEAPIDDWMEWMQKEPAKPAAPVKAPESPKVESPKPVETPKPAEPQKKKSESPKSSPKQPQKAKTPEKVTEPQKKKSESPKSAPKQEPKPTNGSTKPPISTPQDKLLMEDALKDLPAAPVESDRDSLVSSSTVPLTPTKEQNVVPPSPSSPNTPSTGPKNEERSDSVPSADRDAGSLGNKNQSKELVREPTPTTAKANKEAANQQEKKLAEKKPEKTPQQKLEPIAVTEKLVETLDAKMTTDPKGKGKPAPPSPKPNVSPKKATVGKGKNDKPAAATPAQTKAATPPRSSPARTSPAKTVPTATAPSPKQPTADKKPSPSPQQKNNATPQQTKKPDIAPKPEHLKAGNNSNQKGKGATPKSPQKPTPSTSSPQEQQTAVPSKGVNKILEAFTELLQAKAQSKENSTTKTPVLPSNPSPSSPTPNSSKTKAPSSPKPSQKASPPSPKPSNIQNNDKTADIHKVLRKAFALNEKDPTSNKKSPEFDVKDYLTDDQLKDILSKENQQLNINCDLDEALAEKPSQLLNSMELLKSLAAPPLRKNDVMVDSDESDQDFDDDEDEEEEYVEFKFAPRPIYMATICQQCKNPMKEPMLCPSCRMVYYCREEHMKADLPLHKPLCLQMERIANSREGHLYNFARQMTFDDFRGLRVQTMQMVEQDLGRPLAPFEREILLFPRLCSDPICREWKPNLLTVCSGCHHVSYCKSKPSHLPDIHKKWCKYYTLFYKLLLRQKLHGRIEPILPNRILQKSDTLLPESMDEVFKLLFKHSTALKDDCIYVTMTQLATAPLTALSVYMKMGLEFKDTFTIHLAGAELAFEGDTLEKYESFFLHLLPDTVKTLNVVLIGAELNSEGLPVELITKHMKPCKKCLHQNRSIAFDFQCRRYYHEYCENSSNFLKPNIICMYNPTFHHLRSSKFDKWGPSIRAALRTGNCPIIITSYTEFEGPLDLQFFEEEASALDYQLVQKPTTNPFASKKPERNFVSDEIVPLIFKNHSYFVVNPLTNS